MFAQTPVPRVADVQPRTLICSFPCSSCDRPGVQCCGAVCHLEGVDGRCYHTSKLAPASLVLAGRLSGVLACASDGWSARTPGQPSWRLQRHPLQPQCRGRCPADLAPGRSSAVDSRVQGVPRRLRCWCTSGCVRWPADRFAQTVCLMSLGIRALRQTGRTHDLRCPTPMDARRQPRHGSAGTRPLSPSPVPSRCPRAELGGVPGVLGGRRTGVLQHTLDRWQLGIPACCI